MDFVTSPAQIRRNIQTLDRLGRSSDGSEREYHRERIRQGHCFVWTEESGRLLFAPSRFAGYRDNSVEDHEQNDDKNGGRTNHAISDVLGAQPVRDDDLEAAFQRYCTGHGIVPQNRTRRYWRTGV